MVLKARSLGDGTVKEQGAQNRHDHAPAQTQQSPQGEEPVGPLHPPQKQIAHGQGQQGQPGGGFFVHLVEKPGGGQPNPDFPEGGQGKKQTGVAYLQFPGVTGQEKKHQGIAAIKQQHGCKNQ